MIGARWANAKGGGFRWNSHPAYAQSENETTVPVVSKALKVGQRGIYHAKTVLSGGARTVVSVDQQRCFPEAGVVVDLLHEEVSHARARFFPFATRLD